MVTKVANAEASKFRILKARKAKYGFSHPVHVLSLGFLDKARLDMLSWDADAKIELDIEMNHKDFRIYTNSDVAAAKFEAIYCEVPT